MATEVYSGKDGSASCLDEVLNWKLSIKASVWKGGTSASGGWKRAVAGTKEWSGTIEGKDAGTVPSEGDTIALTLMKNDTEGYSGEAIVSSVDVDVDVDTGEPVGLTINFEGNGELSAVGGSS